MARWCVRGVKTGGTGGATGALIAEEAVQWLTAASGLEVPGKIEPLRLKRKNSRHLDRCGSKVSPDGGDSFCGLQCFRCTAWRTAVVDTPPDHQPIQRFKVFVALPTAPPRFK